MQTDNINGLILKILGFFLVARRSDRRDVTELSKNTLVVSVF